MNKLYSGCVQIKNNVVFTNSKKDFFFRKQEDVLEYSGVKRLLEMAVEGFSCTAFCYGQTGSGKTHTLTGPPGLVSEFKLSIMYFG